MINGTTYREITRIPVGYSPVDIGVADGIVDNNVYIANSDSKNVSVISSVTDKEIARIPVGKWPNSKAGPDDHDIVYVSNLDSKSVSVFSGKTLQVQAGVSFDVKPSHASRIVCNNSTVPVNEHFYADYNTQCAAVSNKGFQFTNWVQVLGQNSSRIISISEISDSFWSQLFHNLWIGPIDKSAVLPITQFGNFAANFEKLPPPIPNEYLVPLYSCISLIDLYIASRAPSTFD